MRKSWSRTQGGDDRYSFKWFGLCDKKTNRGSTEKSVSNERQFD